ncbi:hypothetical protein CMI37_38980 [Candidatus Pacearchaeota archaeon]|nr:hypothetical protein [Candidatus Pacearchaeota archaeon]|tara:strand:- start:3216 stop:3566 length:351 start_codon:yes stop_codon:yes gene_type:complete
MARERIGFGPKKERELTYLEKIYRGREVCLHYNGLAFYGVFFEENVAEKLIHLKPSFVWDPEGSKLIMIHDCPTIVPVNSGIPIRPLEEGWLEAFVAKKQKENNGRRIWTPESDFD